MLRALQHSVGLTRFTHTVHSASIAPSMHQYDDDSLQCVHTQHN
jgi:hypothetical protein